MSALRSRLSSFYSRYEWQADACFFLSGFVFDVLTLGEVDDIWSLIQQVVYLGLAGYILFVKFAKEHSGYVAPSITEKFWPYSNLVFHFLLGGLLSIYSLFFIKSSSILASFIFVFIVLALLILNELKFVQGNQGKFKVALFVLCLLLFFLILVPTALGFVGFIPSVLAYVLAGFSAFLFARVLEAKLNPNKEETATVPTVLGGMTLVQAQIFKPSAIVIGGFLFLDLMAWVPPVPVAVQELGVYHQIEKSDGQYLLSHERPWWRFWHSGDQKFRAQEGDRIFIFARIYSPARFEDKIVLHWYYEDPKQGWVSTDQIPISVTGGRREGFRGFAFKSNYEFGDWLVKVETQHGRELGRISVEVVEDKNSRQRVFSVEHR